MLTTVDRIEIAARDRHPSAIHGVLMGVSRTTLGWMWSGRPQAAVSR